MHVMHSFFYENKYFENIYEKQYFLAFKLSISSCTKCIMYTMKIIVLQNQQIDIHV